METEHIREFVRIADEGSFSKAAAALNVTQPAISKHMAALEKQLGTALFVRSNVRTTLTPAGQVFYDDVQAALQGFDSAVDHMKGFRHAKLQRLSISSFHGYRPSDDLLVSLEADLRTNRRNMVLEQDDITQVSPYESLRSGQVDLILVDDLLDDPEIDFTGMESVDLFDDRLVAIVRTDHPLAAKDTIQMAQIGSDVVWTSKVPGVRQFFSAAEKILLRNGANPHFMLQSWTNARTLYNSFAFFEGGIQVNLSSVVKYSAPLALTGYKVLAFEDADSFVTQRAHYLTGSDNPAVQTAIDVFKAAVDRMGKSVYCA